MSENKEYTTGKDAIITLPRLSVDEVNKIAASKRVLVAFSGLVSELGVSAAALSWEPYISMELPEGVECTEVCRWGKDG